MRLIVRLMDIDRRLLGWAECEGTMRGDGAVWAAACGVAVAIAEPGRVTLCNTQWPDLNLNISSAMEPRVCRPGDLVMVVLEGPVFSFTSSEAVLPAVTVAARRVEVPAAAMGVVTP